MPAPSSFTTVMLHKARAEQLRAKAEKDGVSIAETIERFISREMEAGAIPDQTPGFPIFVNDHGLTVAVFGEIDPIVMSPALARGLAKLLRTVAETQKFKTRAVILPDRSLLSIGRKGNGVVIARTPAPGADPVKATMTAGMVRDLARQLRNTADKAERH
jgi:hypothetical protein